MGMGYCISIHILYITPLYINLVPGGIEMGMEGVWGEPHSYPPPKEKRVYGIIVIIATGGIYAKCR